MILSFAIIGRENGLAVDFKQPKLKRVIHTGGELVDFKRNGTDPVRGNRHLLMR